MDPGFSRRGGDANLLFRPFSPKNLHENEKKIGPAGGVTLVTPTWIRQ